jgi:DNA-binding transcriptional LysR family regulator
MEELNDLYLFARVVEAGGFSAAERQTGIPKSRLSRRIAALEMRLGVPLQRDRDRRERLSPSAEGECRAAGFALADQVIELIRPLRPVMASASSAASWQ